MRQMLRSNGQQSNKDSTHHFEMDAIQAARIIEKARKGANWTPETISITEQDVKQNIENLRKPSISATFSIILYNTNSMTFITETCTSFQYNGGGLQAKVTGE